MKINNNNKVIHVTIKSQISLNVINIILLPLYDIRMFIKKSFSVGIFDLICSMSRDILLCMLRRLNFMMTESVERRKKNTEFINICVSVSVIINLLHNFSPQRTILECIFGPTTHNDVACIGVASHSFVLFTFLSHSTGYLRLLNLRLRISELFKSKTPSVSSVCEFEVDCR